MDSLLCQPSTHSLYICLSVWLQPMLPCCTVCVCRRGRMASIFHHFSWDNTVCEYWSLLIVYFYDVEKSILCWKYVILLYAFVEDRVHVMYILLCATINFTRITPLNTGFLKDNCMWTRDVNKLGNVLLVQPDLKSRIDYIYFCRLQRWYNCYVLLKVLTEQTNVNLKYMFLTLSKTI